MALKATIFKLDLQIADMDRGYYRTHMQLQCTIQDEDVWLGDDRTTVHLSPAIWKSPDSQ